MFIFYIINVNTIYTFFEYCMLTISSLNFNGLVKTNLQKTNNIIYLEEISMPLKSMVLDRSSLIRMKIISLKDTINSMYGCYK